MNQELPDGQAGFRKGRGTRDQVVIVKAREFQKTVYFFFIEYARVIDCVDHKKLWEILREMGIPDHLTFLLRNLCAGQEVTDPTWNKGLVPNWERNMSKLYYHPAFFNLYAEYTR